MIAAIIGSRAFGDNECMKTTLEGRGLTGIVSGGAKGADTLAERYARENGLPMETIRPEWGKHGRAAGVIRNREIVNAADIVVAFWDGTSRGTKSSIDFAKKKRGKRLKLYTIMKSNDGVHFLYYYDSLRQRFAGGASDTKSLNFTLYGHLMEDYRTIIQALKMWLGVETAIGCPGHDTNTNNIQKITDNAIHFQSKFARQQKHNVKIKNFI